MKLSFSISCLAAVADAWTYADPAAWATEYANCASTVPNQSPIDIATENPRATTNGLVFAGLPDSATTPEIRSELKINNHTWEIEWDVDDAATTKYQVDYNNKVYRLKQFHIHSPSEHTIDGVHHDMEIHMVHACYGGSQNISCSTTDEDDENLVVAVHFDVGAEDPYLNSVWPQFTALSTNAAAANFVDNMANPYNALVPPSPHDFFRYVGSTTTPSCVQNVEWFIMTTVKTLSQAQLTAYRTAITQHAHTQTVTSAEAPAGVSEGWNVALGANNRPLQVVGDRVPEKYTQPAEQVQQQQSFMWHGVLIFVGLVALAACCLLAFTQLTKPKEKKTKAPTRAVKPKKTEEQPLVTPPAPPAPVPMLFTQPLQVPVTTFASPQVQQVALQPSLMQQSLIAPQARPFMVAP